MTTDELVAHIVKLDAPADTEVRVAPEGFDFEATDFGSSGTLLLWYSEEGSVERVELLP